MIGFRESFRHSNYVCMFGFNGKCDDFLCVISATSIIECPWFV